MRSLWLKILKILLVALVPSLGHSADSGKSLKKGTVWSTLERAPIKDLVIFSAEKPKDQPKLIRFEPAPKPEDITDAPLLFSEFARAKREQRKTEPVSPGKALIDADETKPETDEKEEGL